MQANVSERWLAFIGPRIKLAGIQSTYVQPRWLSLNSIIYRGMIIRKRGNVNL